MSTEFALLVRARRVLANMAAENERKWWEFWMPRWPIHHEPLRGDAKNVVEAIDAHFEDEKVRRLRLKSGD